MAAQPGDGHITHPARIAQRAAFVGGVAGVAGFGFGAFAGTLRTTTPLLFAAASSLQWFAIGTTFWATRISILNRDGVHNWWLRTRGAELQERTDLHPSPQDKVIASSAAGTVTGGVLGYLFRGPRNVIPGMIMFTLFGFAGQHGYDYFDQRNVRRMEKAQLQTEGSEETTFLRRIGKSKWSPMKLMEEGDYEHMLNEKILTVESEIALLDDRIERIRKEAQEQAQKQKQAEVNSKK